MNIYKNTVIEVELSNDEIHNVLKEHVLTELVARGLILVDLDGKIKKFDTKIVNLDNGTFTIRLESKE